MNKAAIFNFMVQKDDRTITVERSFNAPLDRVWAAWTEADILCQWWGPKPWNCVVKSLDFREGGRWHYAMEGPDGERHWSCFKYKTIRPKTFFAGNASFCDAMGVANDRMPKSDWEYNFNERDGTTIVRIQLHFATKEDLETLVQMGFQGGFTMGLRQLDELLAE